MNSTDVYMVADTETPAAEYVGTTLAVGEVSTVLDRPMYGVFARPADGSGPWVFAQDYGTGDKVDMLRRVGFQLYSKRGVKWLHVESARAASREAGQVAETFRALSVCHSEQWADLIQAEIREAARVK